MTTRPVPRNPDVIGVTHIITRAASVIRPIANLDRDGAWVAIARVTSITGSVWARTRVTGAVRRISAIIISASACTDSQRKEQEKENRPLWHGWRCTQDGERSLVRV